MKIFIIKLPIETRDMGGTSKGIIYSYGVFCYPLRFSYLCSKFIDDLSSCDSSLRFTLLSGGYYRDCV